MNGTLQIVIDQQVYERMRKNICSSACNHMHSVFKRKTISEASFIELQGIPYLSCASSCSPDFTICKKRLHSVWPDSFFNHKKQTSPAFALLFKSPPAFSMLKLAHAGKQAHIRLVHISPQTQLGNCPLRVTTDTGRGSIQHWIYLDMDKPRLSHSHNIHTLHCQPATHTNTHKHTHTHR